MIVVSNSSPLIAFADRAVGAFPICVFICLHPPAVAREIAPSIPTLPRWLRVEPLKTPLPERVLRPSLGNGEREALAARGERRRAAAVRHRAGALKGTVTILEAFTREWWLSLFATGANYPVLELHHGLLALALEIQADRILLDDRIARQAADELGLGVTGTVGVLLAAKRHGLIHRVRPLVDLLVQKSFFVGPELYAEILRLAGEQDA